MSFPLSGSHGKADRGVLKGVQAMTQTDGEKRAYSRGYYAGITKVYADYLPPMPPSEVIQKAYSALNDLRGFVDHLAAMFGPGDEVCEQADKWLSKADEAFGALSDWIKSEAAKAAK